MEINHLSLMEQNVDLPTAVNQAIKSSCIVDFGVVLEVLGKGVVKVGVLVARNNREIRELVCTLISTVSKSFSIDIEPQEGDKVLVVYPRTSDSSMFDLSNKEVIVNKDAHGYDPASGLAILYNQFRENDYKTSIKFNKDNEIVIDNTKATITLDKDGYLSYENTDDKKTKLVFTADGMTMQDKNGMKIVSTNTSIKINDHLEIK